MGPTASVRNLGFLPRVFGSHRRRLSRGTPGIDLYFRKFLGVDLAGEGAETGGQEVREETGAGMGGREGDRDGGGMRAEVGE